MTWCFASTVIPRAGPGIASISSGSQLVWTLPASFRGDFTVWYLKLGWRFNFMWHEDLHRIWEETKVQAMKQSWKQDCCGRISSIGGRQLVWAELACPRSQNAEIQAALGCDILNRSQNFRTKCFMKSLCISHEINYILVGQALSSLPSCLTFSISKWKENCPISQPGTSY